VFEVRLTIFSLIFSKFFTVSGVESMRVFISFFFVCFLVFFVVYFSFFFVCFKIISSAFIVACFTDVLSTMFIGSAFFE